MSQAAGGSAGFPDGGALAAGMKPKGFLDARKGRRREPSLRKGDASAAPTRLRLATDLAAAEEEGLLAIKPYSTARIARWPSVGQPTVRKLLSGNLAD